MKICYLAGYDIKVAHPDCLILKYRVYKRAMGHWNLSHYLWETLKNLDFFCNNLNIEATVFIISAFNK